MLELVTSQPLDLGGIISMLIVGVSVGGVTLHKLFYAAKKERRDDAADEVKLDFVEGMGSEVSILRKENRDLLDKVADLRVKLATAENEASHQKAMAEMYARTLGAE